MLLGATIFGVSKPIRQKSSRQQRRRPVDCPTPNGNWTLSNKQKLLFIYWLVVTLTFPVWWAHRVFVNNTHRTAYSMRLHLIEYSQWVWCGLCIQMLIVGRRTGNCPSALGVNERNCCGELLGWSQFTERRCDRLIEWQQFQDHIQLAHIISMTQPPVNDSKCYCPIDMCVSGCFLWATIRNSTIKNINSKIFCMHYECLVANAIAHPFVGL